MVETVAYWVALVSMMAVPAAVAAWLVVHPLAGIWRRVGPVVAYAAVAAVVIGVMWLFYLARGPLLRVHFGVKAPLVCLSAALLAVSQVMRLRVHREVPSLVVLGLPEVSRQHSGQLITSGIYSRIRHPRFVAMSFAVAAVALFTNYLSMYVLALAYIPVICLVAVLEDRELAIRFGAAYQDYRKSVPAFIPRMPSRRAGCGGDAT